MVDINQEIRKAIPSGLRIGKLPSKGIMQSPIRMPVKPIYPTKPIMKPEPIYPKPLMAGKGIVGKDVARAVKEIQIARASPSYDMSRGIAKPRMRLPF